jgi:hypothetical protein
MSESAGVPLVILASARKNGDTSALVKKVFRDNPYQLIDLLDYPVAPYSYSGVYPENDQFPEIIQVLLRHQLIVFATPNYWYSMSGLMKIFFDRLTDLVTIQKSTGRQLKGKSTFLLVAGADAELSPGFETPFQLTSAYLDMEYRQSLYHSPKQPLEVLESRVYSFRKDLLKSAVQN